jgi:hypothetical protein
MSFEIFWQCVIKHGTGFTSTVPTIISILDPFVCNMQHGTMLRLTRDCD